LKAFALDILNGLNEIHKNGIVHCDIKPQNFMLFKNEYDELTDSQSDSDSCDSFDANIYLKISDFGISHPLQSNSGKAYIKFKCGTFNYIAPEVVNVRIFIKIKFKG
jgi:serine/threonine protein kinase